MSIHRKFTALPTVTILEKSSARVCPRRGHRGKRDTRVKWVSEKSQTYRFILIHRFDFLPTLVYEFNYVISSKNESILFFATFSRFFFLYSILPQAPLCILIYINDSLADTFVPISSDGLFPSPFACPSSTFPPRFSYSCDNENDIHWTHRPRHLGTSNKFLGFDLLGILSSLSLSLSFSNDIFYFSLFFEFYSVREVDPPQNERSDSAAADKARFITVPPHLGCPLHPIFRSLFRPLCFTDRDTPPVSALDDFVFDLYGFVESPLAQYFLHFVFFFSPQFRAVHGKPLVFEDRVGIPSLQDFSSTISFHFDFWNLWQTVTKFQRF